MSGAATGGSARADLLLEIGCEEIPARMLESASADFEAIVTRVLTEAGLPFDPAQRFATPRRLAVLFPAVGHRQPDREEDLTGPPAKAAFGPDGAPTKAALAFAQKAGIEPRELTVVSTPKGDYLSARRRVAGRSAAEILGGALPALVAAMSFPKSMRWGDGRRRFVRPVHWVVALHGEEVVPLEILGVRSGRTSGGHRALGARRIELARPADYEARLAAEGIVAGRASRRRQLETRLSALAAHEGVTVVSDEPLAEEVADLVEHPGAVLGSFAPEFLELPRAVLTTTLRHHQKAFSTASAGGALSNRFLSVADRKDDPDGHIRSGNEWVVTGRLEDARFFYREDLKTPLPARLQKLGAITFHAKAGSYLEKTERVRALAAALARRVEAAGGPAADRGALDEAARLAKCDLTTGLVGEFPELQGIAGGIYVASLATDARSAAPVAAAVADHYRPSGAGDDLPRTLEGQILALADKLDTLVVLGAVLGLPKGSRDPYGLRRAGGGIVRLAAEAPLPLSLDDLTKGAPVNVGAGATATVAVAAGSDVTGFLLERFSHWLKEGQGARYDTINAVLRRRPQNGGAPPAATDGAGAGTEAASEDGLPDPLVLAEPLPRLVQKIAALERVRETPDIAALVEIHKRCRNIDAQARRVDERAVLPAGSREDPEENPASDALQAGLDTAGAAVARALQRDAYAEALQELSALRAALSRFFDHALVMHPDPVRRRQRLGLVRRTADLIEQVADLKQIAISREEMQERLGRGTGPS